MSRKSAEQDLTVSCAKQIPGEPLCQSAPTDGRPRSGAVLRPTLRPAQAPPLARYGVRSSSVGAPAGRRSRCRRTHKTMRAPVDTLELGCCVRRPLISRKLASSRSGQSRPSATRNRPDPHARLVAVSRRGPIEGAHDRANGHLNGANGAASVDEARTLFVPYRTVSIIALVDAQR